MDLPDRFLLTGNIRDQYKQLGNGVPWVLGAALGRAIGKAWLDTINQRPWLLDPSLNVSATTSLNDSVSLSTPADIRPAELVDTPPNRSGTGIKKEVDSKDHGSLVKPLKKRMKYVISDDEDDGDDEKGAEYDSEVEILGERAVPKRVRQV